MKKDDNFPETRDVVKQIPYAKGEHTKSSFDLVNQYGTYEIQPTADTENQYPAIAQGFNRKIIETDRQNKHYKGDKFEKTNTNT